MRNRLIQLEQIERGTELLKGLQELKTRVDALGKANQYITNSAHIYAQKTNKYELTHEIRLQLNEEYIQHLKEEIVNMVLNVYNDDDENPRPLSFGVIQDILFKLEILLKRESLYKKITDTLTAREKSEVESLINVKLDEEIASLVVSLRMDLQNFIMEQIQDTEDRLQLAIDELKESIRDTNITIGELSGLHPYLREALGNNRTVKDTLNFLFQIIIDLALNIKNVNDALGLDSVTLVNSYGKELPDRFVLPNDLSNNEDELPFNMDTLRMLYDLQEVSNDDETEAEESEFGSIAEMIKYRKNLQSLDEGSDK